MAIKLFVMIFELWSFMTFFYVDVDPHAAKNSKNDGYDDYYDVGGKKCTIKWPNKIKQSAQQRNLARDISAFYEPKTKKERGDWKGILKFRLWGSRDIIWAAQVILWPIINIKYLETMCTSTQIWTRIRPSLIPFLSQM